MIKFLAYLVCYCIYPFSFLIPRSKKKIAFGSFRESFSDNAKYLFIYASENLPEYDVCWLSTGKNTVKTVKSLGLNARFLGSIRGVWQALRSKYWYVNSYTSDILFCLSGNATVINLWHGVGLKRCEFNINSGTLAKRYVEKNFWECFSHPECFRRPDFLISTTDFQSEMFAKAFRLKREQCLDLGYPRNQILLWQKDDIKAFMKKYEPAKTQDLIDSLQKFSKVFVYMPTWRDSQRKVFAQSFDLDTLNAELLSQNAVMLMKPHANTKVDTELFTKYGNIQFIDNKTDMYGILPFTDVLVTDYSSILYDFLLMDNKDVILYLYDYEEYVRDRDFYYPFDENTVGKKVYDFAQLLESIRQKDYAMNKVERQAIMDKFWGTTMSGDVCRNILKTTLK